MLTVQGNPLPSSARRAACLLAVHILKQAEAGGVVTKPRRPRALVLGPTRELTDQILGVCKTLSHQAKFRSACVNGGASRPFEWPPGCTPVAAGTCSCFRVGWGAGAGNTCSLLSHGPAQQELVARPRPLPAAASPGCHLDGGLLATHPPQGATGASSGRLWSGQWTFWWARPHASCSTQVLPQYILKSLWALGRPWAECRYLLLRPWS